MDFVPDDIAELEFEMNIRKNASGIVVSEDYTYYLPANGERKAISGQHRVDGPAIVGRDPVSGMVTVEHYFIFNRLSRHEGPASIRRDPRTAVVIEEDYAVDGAYHRLDGPARISRFRETGNVQSEAYYRDGKLHREDGPAFVLYDVDGHIKRSDYYLNGQEVTKRPPAPQANGAVSDHWRASQTGSNSSGKRNLRGPLHRGRLKL